MSFDPHARRFVPRRLFPEIETHGEQTSEAPDAPAFSLNSQSTLNPSGREFDEALEQISSEGWCVCPLCGAVVASDGSVVS